jgi:hypothetical protein
VRPTDENQPRSRRPNLMSPSRRASGDIPILAMLEGRASGRRILARPRLLWYGAGGVLACALLAVLASLVRGPAPERDAPPSVIAAATPAVPATRPEPPVRIPHAPTPATETISDRNTAGVDVSAPRSDREIAPRTSGAIAASRIAAAAPSVASAPSVTPAAPPRHVSAHRATSHVGPSRTAPQFAAQASVPAHTDARAARHKRNPAVTRTPAQVPPNVDTDVAVISAILLHTGTRTGGDAADAAAPAPCAGPPCGPRMPSRGWERMRRSGGASEKPRRASRHVKPLGWQRPHRYTVQKYSWRQHDDDQGSGKRVLLPG